MPTVAVRRETIAAAVETHNSAHPESPLPRPTARLLWVMFSSDDVCRQSLEALVAEGFTRKTLPGILCALVDACLLSKQSASARKPRTSTACTSPHRCRHEGHRTPREGLRCRPSSAA
jgi:hypothetical protein